ncbi:CNNM domain-containing protein [Halocalculus aciditolerans]|uniref:HlyC/CorC family transporter n=1 Tax=Halocalculus aciditolerans TaxID=1383812 RepID=A0A830FQT4_9EURY|nr:CNNM domain-containing protein [Halocalculus aciditolerans]GGL72011.1 hypothetical protein GCM10009039_32630 [Halocalculus aciditolerans]
MVDTFLVGAAVFCAVLLAASAFFSSAEIAIFSLQIHRVESLASSADARARTLAALREDPHRLLVTILVGNNVVNVALSTVVAALSVALLPDGAGIALATVVTSVLVLLFGEIAPKAFGVANAESWSLRVARPVAALERALGPVVWLFEHASAALTTLVAGPAVEKPYVTREEILALLHTGAQIGVIDDDERQSVNAVLSLEQEAVEELMTPRESVVAVPVSATAEAARDAALDADVTRVLVVGDTLDDVRGVVTARAAARAARDGATLDSVLDAPLSARDSWTARELYQAFREQNVAFAVVRDAGRRTVGVITRGDLADDVLWRGA